MTEKYKRINYNVIEMKYLKTQNFHILSFTSYDSS